MTFLLKWKLKIVAPKNRRRNANKITWYWKNSAAQFTRNFSTGHQKLKNSHPVSWISFQWDTNPFSVIEL